MLDKFHDHQFAMSLKNVCSVFETDDRIWKYFKSGFTNAALHTEFTKKSMTPIYNVMSLGAIDYSCPIYSLLTRLTLVWDFFIEIDIL